MDAVVLCRPSSPLSFLMQTGTGQGLLCGRHMWRCEATPHGVGGESPVGSLGRGKAWPVGAVSACREESEAGSLSLAQIRLGTVLILKRCGSLWSRRGHWACFLPPGPASPTPCIIGNFHLKIFLSKVCIGFLLPLYSILRNANKRATCSCFPVSGLCFLEG
uniref:Uncharacterized protein n=1 Tax=Rhinopithecus bieti TaxID=61621 RepID=A0A2K6ML06_RHIBE